MGFWCIATAYTLRMCLNISITQMIFSKGHDVAYDAEECSQFQLKTFKQYVEGLRTHYNWNEHTQGIILSSFYYGYVLTHLPGGIIAEKYGAKLILAFGILLTSVLTALTPIITNYGGATALITIRVIEGLAEGPIFPALATLMSRWVPANERGKMASLIFGGAQMGNVMGLITSGLMLNDHGNWHAVFYIFGGAGMIWFFLWILLVYSDPRIHPYIDAEEKEYLLRVIEKKSMHPIPWRGILTSMPFWSIAIGAIGHSWGYFTMLTDLPKYMVDVLKFDIKTTGLLSAIPFLTMWIMSFVFGGISDLCVKKRWLSIKNTRKICTTLSSTGSGLFILMASYVGCRPMLAVIMFTIAMGLMGAYYSGMKVNILDITPNYAGVATALINGLGAVSGMFTPYIVGLLTPDHTLKQWRLAFWIMFVILMVTNIIYLIFAEGDVLWWNDIKNHRYSIVQRLENQLQMNQSKSIDGLRIADL